MPPNRPPKLTAAGSDPRAAFAGTKRGSITRSHSLAAIRSAYDHMVTKARGMNALQREFEKQYRKNLRPERIAALVVGKRCAGIGIQLSRSQIDHIEKQLKETHDDHILIFA